MFDWDEFEHLHVVRKLKEILSQWWNVEVFFADDRGFLRNIEKGEEKTFKNPVLNLLLNSEKGFDSLAELTKNITSEIRKEGKDKITTQWDIGLTVTAFPIYISDEFMGIVMAVGNFLDSTGNKQKSTTLKNLKNMGFSAEDSEEAVTSIKSLKSSEEFYFAGIVSLVAEEIITLHTEISIREERISELNKELGTRYKYGSMIGKSKPMQDLYNLLDKIKSSESTVMIQGENGTGKELIARAIHYNSPRKDRVFVTQNCSAFNDNLLDSELFGHVKGSFTGASRDKKGLFEVAQNGIY